MEAAFSTPLLALDAVVLDTETTGLDPRKVRLLQIGAVHLKRGNLDADQPFEKLINPRAPIPKTSVAVHGITDAMVADGPNFLAVIEDFEAFVGHAIAHDLAVLQREYSIRHDIRARSSVERFNGFVAKEIGWSDSAQLVLDAHRVLLKAVIAQQLVDTESGVPLSTHVEIGRLDKSARARLKQAVKAVAGAIDLVAEGRV